jgi:predicted CopG family antitoxin
MKNLQELKDNYDKNTLKTIVVDLKNYNKLKELGHFGDSYNTIIGRLLEEHSK